jgi:hypothetical protein
MMSQKIHMNGEQGMNFILTATQVAELRKMALTAQNDAELRMIAAREALKQAEKAATDARANYNNTLSVRAGSSITIDLSGHPKAILDDPDDERPKGWQNFMGYSIPSRSGRGKTHDICVNGSPSSPMTAMSCSCPAFKFRGYCWATDALRKGVRFDRTSHPFILDEKGVEHSFRGAYELTGHPEFGLPEKV